MFKNILVPIDLSDEEKTKNAIALTKEMVGSNNIKLTLLSVLPDIPNYVVSELPPGYFEKSNTDAKEKLQQIAQDAHFPATATIKVVNGNPYHQILETSEKEGCDLIVMASHQPGWEDYIFTSVASEVVRNAKCAVLVQR